MEQPGSNVLSGLPGNELLLHKRLREFNTTTNTNTSTNTNTNTDVNTNTNTNTETR